LTSYTEKQISKELGVAVEAAVAEFSEFIFWRFENGI
jgi:hypothetical protein